MSYAFVQLVAGFPQQLVVCKQISKIVPVPRTDAITFVDPFDVNEKIVVIWIPE